MDIDQLFELFEQKTVLVVGDVMIDSYIFGSKPVSGQVPIVNTKRKEKRLGGAANVALNIKNLGATPVLCSVVGDDYEGEVFERLLEAQGMPNKGIISSQNRRTTTKLRVMAGANQIVRVDSEDIHPLVELDRKALLNHINNLAKDSDLIIFEDYDKGTIHSEIISETIAIAEKFNIPVAVDPKYKNFFAYEGATLFKPAIEELEKALKVTLSTKHEAELIALFDQLDSKVNSKIYLVSLEDGDLFVHANGISTTYKTHQTGVADMSGVGNAIISVAGLCLALGLKEEVIAELSNIAAGVVAKYSGVVPISKHELLKETSENQILHKYL